LIQHFFSIGWLLETDHVTNCVVYNSHA